MQDIMIIQIEEINSVKIFVHLLPDFCLQECNILEKLHYNLHTGFVTCFVWVVICYRHIPMI